MSKIYCTITSGRIGKGFEGKPAINVNEAGTAASFSVSVPKYDKEAETKTRWESIKVVAFSGLVNRIEKMQLKAGSFVSVNGSLDLEAYTDKEGVKHSYWQITASDIDFAPGRKPAGDNAQTDIKETATPAAGYEAFDDGDLPF